MTNIIDPNVLAFAALHEDGKAALLSNQPVTATGTGTATSGFSGVAALIAKLTVDVVSGSPTVTVKVQHSPDGTTWADLISFDAATADGVQYDRGESPDDYVRASWTVAGSGSANLSLDVAPVSAAAGGGGAQPLIGWQVEWVNPGGWTVAAADAWLSDDHNHTVIDFDTSSFADPNTPDDFAPIIPDDLGGLYIVQAAFSYYPLHLGGFVAASFDNPGDPKHFAPVIFDSGTRKMRCSEVFELDGGANTLDVFSFENYTADDLALAAATFTGIRIGPLP